MLRTRRAAVAVNTCLLAVLIFGASVPAAPAAFDGPHPAKLRVARNTIDRGAQRLDMLAPITRRASGSVDVELHAAGRRTRFRESIDVANARLRFRHAIPRSQARLGTGIVTLRYPGNTLTQSQEVRLRAARRPARLRAERPTLAPSSSLRLRLRSAGTVSRRARGHVRVQLVWIDVAGIERSFETNASIGGGRWTLDEVLPDVITTSITLRRSTLHSYTLFTGYLPQRVRGEMRSYQMLDEPATPPSPFPPPADASPSVLASAGATAYTENDPATVVDPGVAVSDVDSPLITGAVVRVASGLEAGDVLAFAGAAGISGAYAPATGALTLTGSAPIATYQAALRSITYRHAGEDPALTAKQIGFVVSDGATTSPETRKALAVTPVNDPPTVATTATAMSYREDDGPVTLDPGIVVGDPDTPLAQARVSITAGLAPGEDVLAFANQLGITGAYDPATGILTLTGAAPPAAYQTALRAVSYENTSQNPSGATRTVAIQVTDAAGAASNVATRAIGVTPVADAPVVTASAGALAYTENGAPIAVDGALTVSDADNVTLASATVSLSAGRDAGDALGFADQNGIAGSYVAGTGVLTLTGTSSVANYQTALRSITFSSTNDAPTTSKTVSFLVNDGGLSSAAATKAIAVTAVNDAPTVTATAAALAYAENAGAVAADPGLTLTDPDSAQLSGATVAISTNLNAAQDTLGFADQNGITGSYVAGTGVLTLTGASSVANYQAAMRSVTYANGSDSPSPASRTIAFQVTDSAAAASNVATRAVTIGAVNDPPVVTTSAGALAYTENGAPVAVDGALTVSDADDATLASATVSLSAGRDAGDALGFADQNGIAGSYVAGTGVLTLTGTSSVANYQTALRSITFSSTNDAPMTSKTVSFLVNDGDVDSAAATKAITVTPVNDAPTLATTLAALAYTENDGPVAIDPGLTVTDPDSTQLSGATVTISANFQMAQDDLGFVNQSGIAGLYNDATGVLTLTGGASLAAYQAALRSVTYVNVSEGPSPASRTIAFRASDDQSALSTVATRGIAITAVNDPPTAVDDSATTDEDTALNVVAPGVLANDTDPDPGDTKTVVRLNGSLTLTGTSSEGGSVTINANGSYTYTPPAAFQALSTGESDTDSFQYTMADGAGAQSTATVNLTVDGVSDAPTAVADSYDAIGNTGLFVGTSRPAAQAGKEISGSLLDNDTDPDTPAASLVAEPVTNAATTLGGSITIEADGNFTYHPDDGDLGGPDTFSYRVCDASPCNSGTVANATGTVSITLTGQVWYVRNNEAAGGDGTSDAPFDTLAEAESASGTSDTVFVFDGDNTTSNLDTGYAMDAGERLVGESRPLSLDPDGGGPLALANLHPGTVGAQPTLAASNEDVVVLASNALVDGVDVDPSGAGGGISGGAGTSAVTVSNVNVTDTATLGTQPGIELDGTTGTNTFTSVTVTNGASATAIGVRLNNAGTVNFAAAGTSTITTSGAKALDAAGTNMSSSQWDAITVTGSGTGAIRLNANTGTTTFGDGAGTDLSLVTTSGATAALDIASSSQVTVAAAGSDTIAATGGPAVDIRNSNGSLFELDSVSSTNSSGDAINLDTNLTSPFSAGGGTLAGAAGIAIDVNGGGAGGDVTYAGAINDGSGQSVEVTNRSGGGVTISGTIADSADAGGGIVVSANSAGTTTFSGASKVLNTGAAGSVVLSANGSTTTGHAVSFTGGGLDIDATSGQGLSATGGGLLAVTGSANSITTTTGSGLVVDGTGIAASHVTFQSIASSGATNGIRLNATGTAGGLKVTGTGSAGTGGTIQNTSSDSIVLNTTSAVDLRHMNVTNSAENGINGNTVTGLDMTGMSITGSGDDSNDVGVRLAELRGSAAWSALNVTGSELANVRVENTSGTLGNLAISGASHFDSLGTAFGGNSVLIEMRGTAVMTQGSVDGATFNNNRPARGITVQAQETGRIGDPSTNAFVVQNSTFTDNGLHASFEQANSADLTFRMLNNGSPGTPMTIVNTPAGTASAVNVFSSSTATAGTIRGRISGNLIGNAAVAGSGSPVGNGIRTLIQGATVATLLYDGNTIRQTPQARGIDIQVLGPLNAAGSGPHDITVTNNDVIPSDTTGFPASAIYVAADSQGGGTVTVRADIRGNTVPAGTAIDALPTFLALDEVLPAAVCQLVDTAPASANATAQLVSTNTGSASAAAGCALIAGPISTPP